MNGNLFIISAPSGSGKSTLTNRLRSIVPNLEFSVSYTTRPPRGSEENGRDYFFVDREEFEKMIARDEFLEHAEVFGNYYGTARRFLQEAFSKGNDLLLDIDIQGAAQVKRKMPAAVSVFVLPPSREELERRLRTRSEAEREIQEQLFGKGCTPPNLEEVIRRRLQTASREIENFSEYDYILINDRVDPAIDTLKAIVKADRIERAAVTPSVEDQAVLKAAEAARRKNMLEQVQSILTSFDLSSSSSVKE